MRGASRNGRRRGAPGVPPADDYDVAVAGASVAGCTAARLFAEAGARVALIERRPDPAAYKVVCTHATLPTSTPTIERLGLAPLLTERGVPRTTFEFWTPYGGWFTPPRELGEGWGVTRRTLDPILRELATGTPGVDFMPGWTAKGMLHDGDRPAGLEVEDRGHRRRAIRARLVVGADGRNSDVARLAGVRGRVRPHNRFFYFAYWRGIRPSRPVDRLWILDPNGAAEFPNEDDLTVIVVGSHKDDLAEARADPEAYYLRSIARLPDAPDLSGAERASKLLGKLDVPNVIRPAARPGIAFAGDAALATDPLFGVGLTFAFQSAEWLVDATSGALDGGPELDRALRRYARRFLWRLGSHHVAIADFSSGRPLRPLERRTFRRAPVDPVVGLTVSRGVGRDLLPFAMLDPRFLARLFVPVRTGAGE